MFDVQLSCAFMYLHLVGIFANLIRIQSSVLFVHSHTLVSILVNALSERLPVGLYNELIITVEREIKGYMYLSTCSPGQYRLWLEAGLCLILVIHNLLVGVPCTTVAVHSQAQPTG